MCVCVCRGAGAGQVRTRGAGALHGRGRADTDAGHDGGPVNDLEQGRPPRRDGASLRRLVRAVGRSISPDGGQFDFVRGAKRTCPWGVRAVSLTKSRKMPTRKILPLVFVGRLDITNIKVRVASRSNPPQCGTNSISPAHLHVRPMEHTWMSWRNQEKYPSENIYRSFLRAGPPGWDRIHQGFRDTDWVRSR